MTHTPNAVDALKYAAAILKHREEWATDAIGGSDCTVDHELELEALSDTTREICALAAQFGDPCRYTDGRRVKSHAEIEYGVVTEHVWHPDPAAEEARSWRGTLRHDPGVPCSGLYEVTTTPETQEIHVRVVRTA
ncbi:hypothetical protein BOH72_23370 [Mycobacterium sp. WY10]|nr:hypothetical protein BOH72_23370 [Mycobacterium sp. WY10]